MPLTQTNLPDYPATASTVPLGSTTVFPWPSSPNPGNADLFPGMPNAKGGLIVIAKNVQKVAANFTGRRAIVDDTKCNACHQELGTFTEDAFHAGQRNDGSTCTWCHSPNRSSFGWPIMTDNMTHAIHGAGVRTQKYTWHAVSATEGFWQIVYPGVLARCEQCHLPGTYDFTASGSAAAAGLSDGVDKRLFRTVASGTVAADASKSPYVSAGSFGSTFSFNATTQAITLPAGTNLVTSPTVNACVACHDSTIAISHFKVNGGTFYEARSTAVGATQKVEQCFVCHATGRTAGIKEMHAR
jgi:OmcA/MtrC family decaheme c-type cytochrome